MIFGVAVFSVCSILFSSFVIRKHDSLEKSELASYIMIFAWGSLLFGFLISRIA